MQRSGAASLSATYVPIPVDAAAEKTCLYAEKHVCLSHSCFCGNLSLHSVTSRKFRIFAQPGLEFCYCVCCKPRS